MALCQPRRRPNQAPRAADGAEDTQAMKPMRPLSNLFRALVVIGLLAAGGGCQGTASQAGVSPAAATPAPPPGPDHPLVGTPTPLPVGSSNRDWSPVVESIGGLPMAYVPAGCWMMGSADGQPDELPVHEVCLSAFWIGQTEITHRQYAACVEAGACEPPVERRYYDNPAYADHPVVYVSWPQAMAYTDWLSQESGQSFHLPTEAQWEYAARGPEGWQYPSWQGGAESCQAAQALVCEGVTPVAVELRPPPDQRLDGPSWVGALNMASGAWEWTADWYAPDGYRLSPDGSWNPTGPATGSSRVVRGGAPGFGSEVARPTSRHRLGPHAAVYYLGFRVVADDPLSLARTPDAASATTPGGG